MKNNYTFLVRFQLDEISAKTQKQGCVQSENTSAARLFTERFDQTAPLRDICGGGYPLRDNP